MRDEAEILEMFSRLRRETLRIWIDRGWLAPERSLDGYRFAEIDVARVRLIHEFHYELELDAEAMDVILPLLDQVHGLRRALRRLADAIEAQPDDVRKRIVARLDETD